MGRDPANKSPGPTEPPVPQPQKRGRGRPRKEEPQSTTTGTLEGWGDFEDVLDEHMGEERFTFALPPRLKQLLFEQAHREVKSSPGKVCRKALVAYLAPPKTGEVIIKGQFSRLLLEVAEALEISPETLLQQILLEAAPVWTERAASHRRNLEALRIKLREARAEEIRKDPKEPKDRP